MFSLLVFQLVGMLFIGIVVVAVCCCWVGVFFSLCVVFFLFMGGGVRPLFVGFGEVVLSACLFIASLCSCQGVGVGCVVFCVFVWSSC